MRVRWSTLLLALVLVLGAGAGCGEDAIGAEQLAEDLIAETDGALDETQARCVAEGLEAAYGDDAYEVLLDAAAVDDTREGAGDDGVDEVRTDVIDIFGDCDALGAAMVGEP